MDTGPPLTMVIVCKNGIDRRIDLERDVQPM
jgi:hypothetical protein